MIENEQELAAIKPGEPPEQTFATVVGVGKTGIVLDFGKKEYACSQGVKFAAGQRVLVEKRSGTYVVLCPVGPPAEVAVDKAAYAGKAGEAETAKSAESAKTAETAKTAESVDFAGSAKTADVADAVQSPVAASQKIEFSVSSGALSYRVNGGSWTRLQNA